MGNSLSFSLYAPHCALLTMEGTDNIYVICVSFLVIQVCNIQIKIYLVPHAVQKMILQDIVREDRK